MAAPYPPYSCAGSREDRGAAYEEFQPLRPAVVEILLLTTRRKFLGQSVIAAAAALGPRALCHSLRFATAGGQPLDPSSLTPFVDPLPVPEIARPDGYRPDPDGARRAGALLSGTHALCRNQITSGFAVDKPMVFRRFSTRHDF